MKIGIVVIQALAHLACAKRRVCMSEFYIIEEDKSDTEIDSTTVAADTVSEDFSADFEKSGDELRIEERIGRSWSGVRSCGDTDRINRQVEAAVQGWVKQKLLEYVNWKVLSYGHGEISIRTTNSRGSWPDRRRSCRGSLSGTAFIVFQKP
jgi:hypothetical protein